MTELMQVEDEVALWATQGGGLACWSFDHQAYVWYELPDWYAHTPEITEKIGDPIPPEWDLISANAIAHFEMERGL